MRCNTSVKGLTLTVDITPGSSSTPTPTLPAAKPPAPSKPSTLPAVSSAPAIEDFTPPEPTPQDPYPGYYVLPSGAWAAYDAAYYQRFYTKWKKEYDAHVRALEKGVEKGFEAVEREGAQEVDAGKEMERAKREIQDREEKKALTKGGSDEHAAPKMNIKVGARCLARLCDLTDAVVFRAPPSVGGRRDGTNLRLS